jgi:DNA-binding NarL/FixJ family response regulator
MDLELPGIDGIEAVKIIRKNFPPLPVIMITQHEEEDYVIHAIEAGANGYVLKTAPADKIIQNIKDILNSSPVPSLMAQQILEMFSESFSMRAGSFSNNLDKHEKRILSELIDGKSYKRIAKEMKIDYSELKSQVKTIYKKLDVTSVAGAVAIAVKHNIAHHSDT